MRVLNIHPGRNLQLVIFSNIGAFTNHCGVRTLKKKTECSNHASTPVEIII